MIVLPATFSAAAWDRIAPIYGAILEHPFITGLAAGSLSRDRFKFYLQQDALYLGDFSRALGIIADRVAVREVAKQFLDSSQNALAVEGVLHATFLRDFALAEDAGVKAEKTATCFSYTNYLVATAQGEPVEVAVASVLPCFWIYWEVGRHIQTRAGPSNPYERWINTYGDEVFGGRVRSVIAIADDMAAAAGSRVREDMLAAFHRAARLEWMFWDSAYHRESWPV